MTHRTAGSLSLSCRATLARAGDGGRCRPDHRCRPRHRRGFRSRDLPDGRHIVFEGDLPGGRGLWIISTSGGPAQRLTSRRVGYFSYMSPAWSPEGACRVFGRRFAGGGSTSRPAPKPLCCRLIAPRTSPLRLHAAERVARVVGADGTKLLFVNTATGSVRGDGRIWEAPASGGVAHPITRNARRGPVVFRWFTTRLFCARLAESLAVVASGGEWLRTWLDRS